MFQGIDQYPQLVGVGLDEVFTGIQWRSEVMPDLSMFCFRFLG